MTRERIVTSSVGALGFDQVGEENDLGCVQCGRREPDLEHHSELLIFDNKGRYWHARCAGALLTKVPRQHGRPANYGTLPAYRQWEIDKELGRLDDEPRRSELPGP